MKVVVTQEHIEKGDKGSPVSCPVALALNDAGMEGYYRVESRHLRTAIGKFPLPTEARQFIAKYDTHGGPVEPFEFELDLGIKNAS
ncbi:hypothetical protein SEA_KEELAN_5 [Gordonia phage Keelan]|nr:hypothetical protein SEA_KEELAN_5 [Gordonia phage Keelan]